MLTNPQQCRHHKSEETVEGRAVALRPFVALVRGFELSGVLGGPVPQIYVITPPCIRLGICLAAVEPDVQSRKDSDVFRQHGCSYVAWSNYSATIRIQLRRPSSPASPQTIGNFLQIMVDYAHENPRPKTGINVIIVGAGPQLTLSLKRPAPQN